MQGAGVQVRPAEAGSPSFSIAINKVLTKSQYTKAAQALSRKLRARKNTPAEEAAGAALLSDRCYAINLCTCDCQQCSQKCFKVQLTKFVRQQLMSAL